MRLRRLSRDAIFKEDQKQLVVPIKRGVDPAAFLVGFLRELIPGLTTPARRARRTSTMPPPAAGVGGGR